MPDGRRAFRLALALGAAAAAIEPAAAQRAGRAGSRQLGPNFQPSGIGGGGGGGGLVGGTGQGGSGFSGFVEVNERFSINNNGGGGGNLRASTVFSVGGSGTIDRQRIQAGATGTLQYSVGLGGGRNRFTVNGIARALVEPIRDTLTLTGTAFAGLANAQFNNADDIDPLTQDSDGFAQLYAFTGSANLQRPIGDRFRATANYTASYTDVGDVQGRRGGGRVGGFGGAAISNSFSQFASASIGMIPGTSRLTVTALGSYTRNEQDLLEQRFENLSGTLDANYAVNPDISLVGSVGYQDYQSTRQAIQFGFDYLAAPNGAASVPLVSDPADPTAFIRNIPAGIVGPFPIIGPVAVRNGLLVPGRSIVLFPGQQLFLGQEIDRTQSLDDPDLVLSNVGGTGIEPVTTGFGPLFDQFGQFVPNPLEPRDTLFSQRGVVWNAGLRYTPTRRLFTELRLGQRFQQVTVTGVATYQIRRNAVLRAELTDGIETFGTITTRIIDGVPVSVVRGTGRGGGFGFAGGGSLTGQLQSITSGIFRSRIGQVSMSVERARSQLGFSIVYNQRDYLDRGQSVGPGGIPIDPTLADRSDRSIVANATYSRGLGQRNGINASVGGGYFDRGLLGQAQNFFLRASVRGNRSFNERLQATANLSATQRFAAGEATVPTLFGVGQQNRTNFAVSAGLRYLF